MNICILEITSEYRGDHAAEVSVAHEYVPEESVENLIMRCLCGDKEKDHIELRIIKPKGIDPKNVPF